MADSSDIVIREYRPGDEVAILEAFNRIFAATDPGFLPRTAESWRWQFAENPAGRRIWIAVDRDGTVLAQQAGVPLPVLVEGTWTVFSQVVDSFSDPRARSLGKRTLFVDVVDRYWDHHFGPIGEKDAVAYGLPVREAWRIGHRFLSYEMVRTQSKLTAPPGRVRPGAAAGVEVEEVERFPEEVRALFDRCAGRWGAIGLRDAERLDWRFVARPDHRYVIALARRGSDLVGFAVFRACVFDGREDGMLCDWLAAPDDEDARNALLAWGIERAKEASAEHLTAVVPDVSPEWLAFQRAGLRVRPTRYFLTARSFPRRLTMDWLYERWFYTLGDFDLV